MADSVMSFAIENVGKLVIEEGKFLRGVRDQVEEMQIELEWMQCFLKDAEERKGESNRVRHWVSQVRQVTYDVEDLVERFVLKSALRNQKGVMNCIKKYAFFINHVAELHQVGSKIEGIKVKLATLRTRLQIYGIRELRVGREDAHAINRRRQDYAHVLDHNVVGLDEKIAELVSRLLDGQYSAVCIFGMGGLGKTTTAKQIYINNKIRAHFESFAWVYISQELNQKQVWRSILTQLLDNKETVQSMAEDDLAKQLCRLQKEKKCLIIIDDIWRNQDWNNLSAAFPYMEKDSKSKILLTSRYEGVVASLGVHHTSLDLLDSTSSLKLLKNTILFLGGPYHPMRTNPSMETQAAEMVKECAGLPLAITVLGGILAAKQELNEWERVSSNIKSLLRRGEQQGNGVAGVLELSYEDLSYNIRSCFLYFSQYPEDEEIKKTELIQRWIGEGFVPFSKGDGGETIEDIAEGYLNELASRCMIQVGKRSHTGRIKTCRVHDLMRDLCISKARDEGFALSLNMKADGEEAMLEKVSYRRLCIFPGGTSHHKPDSSLLSSLVPTSPHVRSIRFHFPDSYYDGGLDDDERKEVASMVANLKLVRVLRLTSTIWTCMSEKWRSQMGDLIHLRFLTLGVQNLPKRFGNLRCLQTLDLRSCIPYLKIPNSIWEIEQLRHLYFPRSSVCESSEQNVCDFRNLQTLVNFPPENFDMEQNLIKFARVRKLVLVRSFEMIHKEIVFKRLQSLFVSEPSEYIDLGAITRGSPSVYRLIVEAPIRLPETDTWPSNLSKLVLTYTLLDEGHIGALAKLQSLKALFLYDAAFSGKEMVFCRGDFPQLRHLLVSHLWNLEEWEVKEGALPSLSCLEICCCKGLESVPNGSEFLKKLKELKIKDMPSSFRKRVEEGGEDWDRVSHVVSFTFL